MLELPNRRILSAGFECVIHLHSAVDSAIITEVTAVENPETKQLIKATFLRSGQIGVVRIKVNSELCLEKFNFMETLGRFTLRDAEK